MQQIINSNQPVAALTDAWLDKMQSYGVVVSENHTEQAVKIAEVLNHYNGKIAHQVAIPAAAGFGKSVMIEEFAKSVANRPDRPLLVVKLLKDEVATLVDAINDVAPGSAMAIKARDDFETVTEYIGQFDSARWQNIVVMTHAMFQTSLVNGRHRDIFDRRENRIGSRRRGGVRRQIIMDEVPNFIMQHEFTLGQVDQLIADLDFVAEKMPAKYRSSMVDVAIDQIKVFRDRFAGVAIAKYTTPRFEAVNVAFNVPMSLNNAVKAMKGYDVAERLAAVESAIRAGMHVSNISRVSDGGSREVALTGHVAYSLADVAGDLPMICFDFTADIDPRYLEMPGLQQLQLDDTTDYSNVTFYFSNYSTFSKSHHSKEEYQKQFVRILKEAVWPKLNGEVPMITFHKKFIEDYVDMLEEEGLEFEYKVADSGRSDNSFSHLSAAIISGPLTFTAGTYAAMVEVIYAEPVGTSYTLGKNGITHHDPRVQSFVEHNDAVHILQTAARIRYARGKEASVFVFGMPDNVRKIVASKLPGAKFVDLKLKGLRHNKSKKRDSQAEKLRELLENHDGDTMTARLIRDKIGVPARTFTRFKTNPDVLAVLKETGWRFASTQKLERVTE